MFKLLVIGEIPNASYNKKKLYVEILAILNFSWKVGQKSNY